MPPGPPRRKIRRLPEFVRAGNAPPGAGAAKARRGDAAAAGIASVQERRVEVKLAQLTSPA